MAHDAGIEALLAHGLTLDEAETVASGGEIDWEAVATRLHPSVSLPASSDGMGAVPAALIYIPVEGSVYVRFHGCEDEQAEMRLFDWLATRDEYVELIERAVELATTK